MSRPLVRIYEKIGEVNYSEVRNKIANIAEILAKYLNNYYRGPSGFSKHTIMGPVGKLIGVLESERFQDKDALLGYIINIHTNLSGPISKEAVELLEKAINDLLEIRSQVSTRIWIRLLRELDYAVYKHKMKYIVERAAAKSKTTEKGE